MYHLQISFTIQQVAFTFSSQFPYLCKSFWSDAIFLIYLFLLLFPLSEETYPPKYSRVSVKVFPVFFQEFYGLIYIVFNSFLVYFLIQCEKVELFDFLVLFFLSVMHVQFTSFINKMKSFSFQWKKVHLLLAEKKA